jgi:hypothetical protein
VSKDGSVTQTNLYKTLFPMQGEAETQLDDIVEIAVDEDEKTAEETVDDFWAKYDRKFGLGKVT